MIPVTIQKDSNGKRRKVNSKRNTPTIETQPAITSLPQGDAREHQLIRPFPVHHNYVMHKRTPLHGPAIQPNEIYVSSQSTYIALLKRAKKIINRKLYGGKVILHGLGSTIETTCNLALQIQQELGGSSAIQLQIKTETVPLIDDFEPLDQQSEPLTQIRFNSAIHITIEAKESS